MVKQLSVGEDMEQLKMSYTADERTNWFTFGIPIVSANAECMHML